MSIDRVPDYESIERREWRRNAQQVTRRLADNEPSLAKRIATYIDRFGYDEATVCEKIEHDPMFAAHFAKEPRRTSLHQAAPVCTKRRRRGGLTTWLTFRNSNPCLSQAVRLCTSPATEKYKAAKF